MEREEDIELCSKSEKSAIAINSKNEPQHDEFSPTRGKRNGCEDVLVFSYEEAVIFRCGKSRGSVKPGCFCAAPCCDKIETIDMRDKTIDIPSQEIITNDSVSILVDAVVYQRTFDSELYLMKASDAKESTILLASSALRDTLSTRTLAQILTDRSEMKEELRTFLDEPTNAWGVEVTRVEIKSIHLPESIKNALAIEAQTVRKAKAKTIEAEGEKEASKALSEAAAALSGSPISVQLRYLQSLTTMSAKRNHTLIVPLPVELIQKFSKR
ncbi:hypothetical protein SNEBB_010944 [Seison nebaliae]|nr:hypothetical protein SNEBB_010944 [Seison nebaliae]